MKPEDDYGSLRENLWGIGVAPPPLFDWLARVLQRTMHKGGMVSLLSRASGFSLSVVRTGGPQRPKAVARFLAGIDAAWQRQLAALEDEAAGYGNALRALDGREFACFRASLGMLDDPELRELCSGVDWLSTLLFRQPELPAATGPWLVELAKASPAFPGDVPEPVAPERAALDALLMLNARMDHALWERYGRAGSHPQSLFARLAPLTDASGTVRGPFHRLFDVLFGLHSLAHRGRLPAAKPTIRELDALFDGLPESGGQSLVVRWRNGLKLLRHGDMQLLSARVSDDEGIRQLCGCLYMAAVLWQVLLDEPGDLVQWKQDRYQRWWEAGLAPSARRGLPPDPYWDLV